jgi:hypothetical protein
LYFHIFAVCLVGAQTESYPHVEYPPFDGWYNNWAHPDWGAAETTLYRRLAPAYSDGVYEPSGAHRPNPMEISMAVFSGKIGFPSVKNRSALLVFFGEVLLVTALKHDEKVPFTYRSAGCRGNFGRPKARMPSRVLQHQDPQGASPVRCRWSRWS